MPISDDIRHIQESLRAGHYTNEAAVSNGVVLRLLLALGWPVFDSRVVWPEFSVEGKRVDFALCHPPTKPAVIVEVKQVGQVEGADRQLFEYAFHIGIPMAILTDGQVWNFYLPAAQGDYQERCVYQLDILERQIDECVKCLERYLSFQRVCDGRAMTSAREDHEAKIRLEEQKKTLPIAWHKLMEEHDSQFIDLISDKVASLCGTRPNQDLVAGFLELLLKKGAVSKPDLVHQHQSEAVNHPLVPTAQGRAARGQFGFTLRGRHFPARNGRDVLTRLFEEVARLDPGFMERFTARPHGRNRRYAAREQAELYPKRPDLCRGHSYQTQTGWWIGTNYSRQHMRDKIIKMICEVAGLGFGTDVIVEMGED